MRLIASMFLFLVIYKNMILRLCISMLRNVSITSDVFVLQNSPFFMNYEMSLKQGSLGDGTYSVCRYTDQVVPSSCSVPTNLSPLIIAFVAYIFPATTSIAQHHYSPL